MGGKESFRVLELCMSSLHGHRQRGPRARDEPQKILGPSLWKPLWRHHNISHKVKLRIYSSSVLSFLLYGLETWSFNKTLAAKIDGFDSTALRTIKNIRWPQQITNKVLRDHTCQPRASCLALPASPAVYRIQQKSLRLPSLFSFCCIFMVGRGETNKYHSFLFPVLL